MDIGRSELKITVAKFIEVAYSIDEGMTTKILAQKGNAKLTVDQNGNATLSGSAGILTFSGNPVLDKIGVKIKRVSVNFTNEDGYKIRYSATVNLALTSIVVTGTFDLEALITACSGLLCRAARSLKGRDKAVDKALDMQMQHVMGL